MARQSFIVGSLPCYYFDPETETGPEQSLKFGSSDQSLNASLTDPAAQAEHHPSSITEASEQSFIASSTGPEAQPEGTSSFPCQQIATNSHPQQHQPLPEIQAAGTDALWDPKKLFLTFDDREVFTLSEVDLVNFFNKEIPGCVGSVTLSQDSRGYWFGTLELLQEGCAEELLQRLPSKFYKVRSQWVKARKFFNRYPPF